MRHALEQAAVMRVNFGLRFGLAHRPIFQQMSQLAFWYLTVPILAPIMASYD